MTLDRDAAVEPLPQAESETPAEPGNWPARILAYGAVLPAVIAAAWLLAGLLLVTLHIYRPAPAIVLGLVVAVAVGRPPARVARARARSFGAVPWWVAVGVLAVVIGFGVLAFATSSGDVLVRRDPGSYAMSATWLSKHGTIQMPSYAPAFGGNDPNLVLASMGFYLQGAHIIPQFMTGVPVLMAVGGWISGIAGILHSNAFIGGFALLAFAGLAARLIGPKWAPLAVLTLALVQPELDVMRATYSEPSAQLLLLGGLALLVDALAMGRLWARRGAASAYVVIDDVVRTRRVGLLVAGVVLGLVSVVRIDAIADLLPLVFFIGWLALHRLREWRFLAWGLGAGLFVGALDCQFLTLPYAKHVGGDLVQAVIYFVVAVVVTIVAVHLRWWWRRKHPDRPISKKWPPVAAAAVFVGGLFFYLRPHLMTMRSSPTSGGANYVAQVQRYLGMPSDPTRSYYEDATRWMSWYLGWATLAIALVGAIWLAYQLTRGRQLHWLPAYLVFVGMTAAVLLKPSITPDHPWADRRFVPVAYPGVVLLAFVVVALVVKRAAAVPTWEIGAVRFIQAMAVSAAVLVIVAPAWWGSRHVFTSQTEAGEVGAVQTVCKQLRPGDAVLTFGNAASSTWPGTLRIMCGKGVAYLDGSDNATALKRIFDRVQARGGRLMILVDGQGDQAGVPGTVAWPATPTAKLQTTELGHTLVTRPDHTIPLGFNMYLGELKSVP